MRISSFFLRKEEKKRGTERTNELVPNYFVNGSFCRGHLLSLQVIGASRHMPRPCWLVDNTIPLGLPLILVLSLSLLPPRCRSSVRSVSLSLSVSLFRHRTYLMFVFRSIQMDALNYVRQRQLRDVVSFFMKDSKNDPEPATPTATATTSGTTATSNGHDGSKEQDRTRYSTVRRATV